jgi:hypothetical protein
MGAGADVSRGLTPPEPFLDTGETHATEGGNGRSGAKPLIRGSQNLLSQVDGIGFYVHEPHRVSPYRQQELL